MLLIHNCGYTLLGARNEQGMQFRIDTVDINNENDVKTAMLQKKHDLIIIQMECIYKYQLREVFSKVININHKVKILVLTSLRWPKYNKPLKLSNHVYLVEGKGLSLLVSLYKNNSHGNYFPKKVISLTNNERKIIELIINDIGIHHICNKLNIRPKTISSHVSNIKKNYLPAVTNT